MIDRITLFNSKPLPSLSGMFRITIIFFRPEFVELFYCFDGDDILIPGKQGNPPSVLFDQDFLPFQADGVVLDCPGIDFETIFRIIVHEWPVFGGDHEPSIHLRHLGVGDSGSNRVGDEITVQEEDDENAEDEEDCFYFKPY